MKTIRRELRYFFESVTNLFRWLPVIWKDRQFDHDFIYRILLQKIFLTRKYHQKRQFYEGWEEEVKWMMICERLLTNLTESVYWKGEYDNKPLNLKNIDNPIEDRIFAEDAQWLKDAYMAEIREEKAKRLLFNILSWRIEYWWD